MRDEYQEILDAQITELRDELELKNEGLQTEIISQALRIELMRHTQAIHIDNSPE